MNITRTIVRARGQPLGRAWTLESETEQKETKEKRNSNAGSS